MAKFLCPVCKTKAQIDTGVDRFTCSHCGSQYKIITRQGKRMWRPGKPRSGDIKPVDPPGLSDCLPELDEPLTAAGAVESATIENDEQDLNPNISDHKITASAPGGNDAHENLLEPDGNPDSSNLDISDLPAFEQMIDPPQPQETPDPVCELDLSGNEQEDRAVSLSFHEYQPEPPQSTELLVNDLPEYEDGEKYDDALAPRRVPAGYSSEDASEPPQSDLEIGVEDLPEFADFTTDDPGAELQGETRLPTGNLSQAEAAEENVSVFQPADALENDLPEYEDGEKNDAALSPRCVPAGYSLEDASELIQSNLEIGVEDLPEFMDFTTDEPGAELRGESRLPAGDLPQIEAAEENGHGSF